MNIAEKIVTALVSGCSENRAGMKAQSLMNWSPPDSSIRKNNTLRPISAKVTTGTVLRCESSSPIGNMSGLHLVRLYPIIAKGGQKSIGPGPHRLRGEASRQRSAANGLGANN